MVRSMVDLYFANARTVAAKIGMDAYFFDERVDRVVRRQPDGTLSLLKPLALNTRKRPRQPLAPGPCRGGASAGARATLKGGGDIDHL